MVNGVRIAAAGLLAYGAWLMYQNRESLNDTAGDWIATADTAISGAGQSAAQLIDSFTMGTLRLSNMSRVTAADVTNKNVRAFLRVIRVGEGTADPDGYRRLFGGQLFDSYADHPRQRITRTMGGQPITSTAAGAYQFLARTWDETARIMGLKDFTPASQDLGAVGRIAARGALEDVKAGRFDAAIRKVALEWASMPGSPYGQPVITWDRARAIYAAAGGAASATV
jgi:muramidase (phage lysozyme)